MVVKFTFYGSRGTFSEQRFWSKSLNISIFSKCWWSFRDNSKQLFSLLTKLQKSVSRNNLRKNLLREKKSTSLVFSRFWAVFFAFSEKFMAWLSKLQSTYLLKVLRENIYFWKLNMVSTFFGLWEKKMGLSVKKFFSGFNQQKFALPEKYFDEKRFVFRKSFRFLLSCLEFEWFLCLIAKLFSQVCQTTDHCAESNYWEN